MSAETNSESDFSREAEAILDTFLAKVERDKDHQSRISGVSIFEPNAAPLALYYIRKGLLLESLGQTGNGGGFHIRDNLLKAAWLFRETFLTAKAAGRRKERLQPAEILFICNVSRQYESIVPVIRELCRNNIRSAVVSQVPLTETKRHQSPNVCYYDSLFFRNVSYWKDLLLKIPAWKAYWKKRLRPRIDEKELTWIEQWFQQKGQRAIRSLLFAARAIDEISPKVIVVTDPADAEAKSVSLVGKMRGIPSLCVQYGMAGPHDSEWHFFAQDFVGAFDSECVKMIRSHGVPDNKILLTGSPRFDSYRHDPERRSQIRGILKVPNDFFLIVFFSIPPAPQATGKMESYISLREHDELMASIYKLAGNNPWIVAVKPHPEEDAARHQNALTSLGSLGRGVRLIRNLTSYELINAADLVITSHSTTGLEAICLDKPLITVNFTDRPDYEDYASSGAAWPVRQREDLATAVGNVLRDPELEKRLQEGRILYKARNPYFESASSTKRCAEIIMDLQKGRTPKPQ